MKRSVERILTTHVGSLIRPPDLLALSKKAAAQGADHQQYEQALTSAVADIVKRQIAAGIDIVNDGEFMY